MAGNGVNLFTERVVYRDAFSQRPEVNIGPSVEPLSFPVQEYRTFDFLSPWEGVQALLPGDEKAAKEDG